MMTNPKRIFICELEQAVVWTAGDRTGIIDRIKDDDLILLYRLGRDDPNLTGSNVIANRIVKDRNGIIIDAREMSDEVIIDDIATRIMENQNQALKLVFMRSMERFVDPVKEKIEDSWYNTIDIKDTFSSVRSVPPAIEKEFTEDNSKTEFNSANELPNEPTSLEQTHEEEHNKFTDTKFQDTDKPKSQNQRKKKNNKNKAKQKNTKSNNNTNQANQNQSKNIELGNDDNGNATVKEVSSEDLPENDDTVNTETPLKKKKHEEINIGDANDKSPLDIMFGIGGFSNISANQGETSAKDDVSSHNDTDIVDKTEETTEGIDLNESSSENDKDLSDEREESRKQIHPSRSNENIEVDENDDVLKEIFGSIQDRPMSDPYYTELDNSKARLVMNIEDRLFQNIDKLLPTFKQYNLDESIYMELITTLISSSDYEGFLEGWRIIQPNYLLTGISEEIYDSLYAEATYYSKVADDLYTDDIW